MQTGWWDVFDPFTYLGDKVADAVAGIWTMMMVAVWNSGLWVLRLEFSLIEAFTTPDIAADGPARVVYQVTFWLAGAMVLIFALIQVGAAAFRRDGQSLARAAIGAAQFGLVLTAWIGYAAMILVACGGLSQALATMLLKVDTLSQWEPWGAFSVEDITDGATATVLGIMGALLWLSAIGRLLVMLVRAVALLVLCTTAPISASGLVWEGGRAWFWKTFRWFHAAAFTPVLMMLMLGLGVQISNAVVAPGDTPLMQQIGTALPAILLILISCFSPLALFKLLAFTDPGSSSGAAMRQGIAANGGIQNLLSGARSGGGDAASSSDGGRAAGEAAGEEATSSRFAAAGSNSGSAGGAAGAGSAGAGSWAAGGSAAAAGGAAGGAATGVGLVLAAGAMAYGAMSRVGTQGAAMVSDLGNQAGVGHDTYQPDAPDFGRQRTNPSDRSTQAREAEGSPATGTPERQPQPAAT